jgi:uncharacterized membrane protein
MKTAETRIADALEGILAAAIRIEEAIAERFPVIEDDDEEAGPLTAAQVIRLVRPSIDT